MKTVRLGRTTLRVSAIGLGTSALGGVYGGVGEAQAIATVDAALEEGITLFDTAPAYGATLAESRLGAALRGVDRSSYVLSTKAGKRTDGDGRDHFDFTAEGIRRSVEASLARLGVDRVDILHLHDFEYEGGRHVERAMDEGFATLHALASEGIAGAVGAGIYPLDLWKRVLTEADLDVALVHNHHTLCDLRAFELLPLAEERGVGILNAAPFGSGLLTGAEPPPWHPAPPEARAVFAQAAETAEVLGVPLPQLALAYSCQEPRLPVTVFSCADPATLRRNLAWAREPVDRAGVAKVQRVLEPVMHRQWTYGSDAPRKDEDAQLHA